MLLSNELKGWVGKVNYDEKKNREKLQYFFIFFSIDSARIVGMEVGGTISIFFKQSYKYSWLGVLRIYIGFGKYFVTLCCPNREVVDQCKILQC